MAIITAIGNEAGDNTTGWTIGSGFVDETTIVNSGTKSWRNPATASDGLARQMKYYPVSFSSGVTRYARIYFRIASVPTTGTILSFDRSATYNVSIFINTSGQLELQDNLGVIGTSAALSANTWYRVELKLTQNGSDGSTLDDDVIEARLDGATFASTTTGRSRYWPDKLLIQLPQNSSNWYIDDIEINDSTWPGGTSLDITQNATATNININGVASSASTNDDVYTSEVLSDNPSFYWKLDETSGTTVAEEIVSANGTISGDPELTAPGETNTNTAIRFDGTNDYVTTTTLGSLGTNLSGGYSIEFWAKWTWSGYDKKCMGVYDGTSSIYIIMDIANDGQVSIRNQGFERDSAIGFGDGEWHHVVFTVDPYVEDNPPLIYIDGELSHSGTGFTGAGTSADFTKPMVFGAHNNNGSIVDHLPGSLDEIAFYEHVLTPDRIVTHYELGSGIGSRNYTDSTSISIASTESSVTVTSNSDNVADSSNIDIVAQPANIVIDNNVVVDSTDIAVAGHPASLSTTVSATVESTDIQLRAISPSAFGGTVEVNADVINISLQAYDATVSTTSNVEIAADLINIDIAGHPAQITADRTIEVAAPKTNINIQGPSPVIGIVANPYADQVESDGPLHWYRFNNGIKNPLTDEVGTQNLSVQNAENINLASDGIYGDTSGNSLTVTGLTAADVPTAGTGSYTFEVWIKTSSSSGTMFSSSWYGSDSEVYAGFWDTVWIGLRNGRIAKGYLNSSTSTAVVGPTLNDGTWHHLVFTREVSGSTKTYRTYVDGVQISPGISVDELFFKWGPNITENRNWTKHLFSRRNIANNTYEDSFPGKYDEVATYSKLLSAQRIQTHWDTGTASVDVAVNAVATNIDLKGIDTPSFTWIDVESTNINLRAKHPNLEITGGRFISAGNDVEYNIVGPTPTMVIERNPRIETIVTNINLRARRAVTQVGIEEIKFIPVSDTSVTAEGAEFLEELDFGALLYTQIKEKQFKIGNTSDAPIRVDIKIQTVNEELKDNFALSLNGYNYYTNVIIPRIEPNEVTDPIYLRLEALLDPPAHATALINVEQVNA